jgi:hypothetical protein
MIADSIKAQLEDAAHVMKRQMQEIDRLRAEVERLQTAAGAHDVLRSIYADANQPTGHRLKAAGLALGVETAPLKSVEPPLELVAEVVEPLAVVVERQGARADALRGPLIEQTKLDNEMARLALRHGGNGSDSSSD